MSTEKEKMIAGQFYMAADAELRKMRTFARQQMKKFNEELDGKARSERLKSWFGTTGQRIYMEPNFYCDYDSNIHVGEDFTLISTVPCWMSVPLPLAKMPCLVPMYSC